MQPNFKTHKFAGVLISIAAVIAVGFITSYKELAKKTVGTSLSPSATAIVLPSAASAVPPASIPSPVSQTAPAEIPKRQASIYKDGIYTATGSYMSPGGYDQITVTLTLANGIVTDASIVSGAGDGTSQRYQDRFASGYKQYVIGQDIATLNLSRVSGSSLTPIGFNDAVSQIRTAAKS